MPTPRPHPWLDLACAELGIAATPGPASEAHVQRYYTDAGHPEIQGDDVAWCAAFVGACLERAGIKSTRSLLARSYLIYGEPISEPQPGAIAIFSRGTDPTQGHVAFVVGSSNDTLFILGGNQSNAVSVIAMPRSRLLGLRWPTATTASPTASSPTTNDSAFSRALAHVLSMEGGFTEDPYDPGGPTNLGITLADLASYRGLSVNSETTAQLKSAVQALTPSDVAPIYRTRYWQPCQAPALPPPLALFHFDTAVNHGLGAAARMLQQSLSVGIDGEIGPQTLAAANAHDPLTTLTAYADIRRARYRAIPTFWRFGRGWLKRVDATYAAAQALITEPSPSPTPEKDTPMTNSATSSPTTSEPKWWGQSLTIWGTIVTTLATVLPVVGPLIGFDISAEMVRQLGDGVVHVGQALGGVIGVLMAIYGRTRAFQPLIRRDFMVKL